MLLYQVISIIKLNSYQIQFNIQLQRQPTDQQQKQTAQYIENYLGGIQMKDHAKN